MVRFLTRLFSLSIIALFGLAIHAHEKHIVVVIPSYNNADCYDTNLDSVFNQKYHNFTAVYINDCSPDGTGDLVAEYIDSHGWHDRMQLINNEYNRKAVANLYRVIQECDDTDLIVLLDGDDAFAHERVLARINEIFSKEDIWAAYAQYMNVPIEKAQELKIPIIGYAKPTPESMFESRNFRNNKVWVWSGCRIFYAWLFKQIKLEDLILPADPYKGKFFPTSYDAALMWPFLEMAGRRVKFIDEILLHRNIDTPLNDFKINNDLQRLCGKTLLNNPRYDALPAPVINRLDIFADAKADVVLFVDQKDMNTDTWIAEFKQKVSGYGELILVSHNAKDELISHLKTLPNDHVLLIDAAYSFSSRVDLNECIRRLEQTYAQGVYFTVDVTSFGQPIGQERKAPCEQLWDDLYAWQFLCADALKDGINTLKGALYRKQDALALLQYADKKTFNAHNVGLFYAASPLKMVKIQG